MNKMRILRRKVPSFWNKCIRLMKLTFLFLMIGLIQVSASVYSQTAKLTLKMRDAKVAEVLDAIENQSEFRFAYNPGYIDLDRKLSVDIHEKTVEESLDVIFKGTDVEFAIRDRHILLFPVSMETNSNTIIAHSVKTFQQKTVTGKVTDSDGQPLPGVSIVIKGTTQGTITNADGEYSITNIPADATLVFSFVGMKTQEIVVGTRANINVTLEEDVIGIEEVVAVGYGIQRKENLTGSIAQVSSEILENRSVTSISQALQGTMSGVTVQQTDGRPGADANIRIRGFSSLNLGGSLVIVDGIPGDLNSINPNDIESISVLKDAASAAIYGARGAEGVILVTTKSGEKGKIEVKYQGNVTIQTPTRFPEQAHSYDGAMLANLSAQNAGASPFYSQDLIEKMKDPSITAIPRADGQEYEYVADFDWAGYFLKSSLNQNHNVSISGGGNGNTYLLSAAWLDQNGYFSKYGPDNFDRYNLRLNMINDLVPNKLFLDTRLSLTRSDRIEISNGTNYLMQSVIQAGRSMPLYNPDGTYARYRMQQNTLQLLEEAGFDKDLANRFEGRMTLDWKVNSDLELKAQVGYNINWNNGTLFGRSYYKYRPSGATNFGWINQPNRVILNNSYSRFYTSQILADYLKKVQNHTFKLFIGGSVEENLWENFSATRFNILGNELPALNLGSADDAQNGYSGNEWGIVSGFGRFNYDFNGKYLFEANFRADASSRFSEKHRWGFFPSFSAGWRVTEETFMESQNLFSN